MVRILSRLARSLTATGEVTPLADGGSIGAATITVDDFLIDDVEVNSKVRLLLASYLAYRSPALTSAIRFSRVHLKLIFSLR